MVESLKNKYQLKPDFKIFLKKRKYKSHKSTHENKRGLLYEDRIKILDMFKLGKTVK